MKKLTLVKWILPLFVLFIFAFQSCKDDSTDYEINGEPGGGNSMGDISQYGTGAIPGTEQDWVGIPILTDVNQLNLGEPSAQKKMSVGKLTANGLPPVFGQGAYGTCVSSSIAYGVSMLIKKMSGMEYTKANLYPDVYARTFSVAYLHYFAHLMKGTKTEDIPKSGMSISNGLKALEKYGISTAYDYKYTEENMKSIPKSKIQIKAEFNSFNIFRIPQQGYLTKNLIKQILDRNGVVFFGIGAALAKDTYFRNGKVIMGAVELLEDKVYSTSFTYHVMTIIDYDDSKQAFLVLNSWGNTFGGASKGGIPGTPDGCFWLKYDVIGQTYGNGTYIIDEFSTLGLKDDVKIANQSLLYEFTGYDNYEETEYSKSGVKMGSSIGKDITVKIEKEGYIKYPGKTVIPTTGTIEFEISIDGLYKQAYSYSKPEPESNNTGVIFSTYVGTQPGNAKGAMELRLNKEGLVTIRYAYRNYEDINFNDPNDSGSNVVFFTVNTSLKPGSGFKKVGISYGNGKLIIRMDGKNVLELNENSAYKLKLDYNLSNNMKKFTLGYSLTSNNTKNQYQTYEGFIGNLKSFRTSDKANDWVIAK